MFLSNNNFGVAIDLNSVKIDHGYWEVSSTTTYNMVELASYGSRVDSFLLLNGDSFIRFVPRDDIFSGSISFETF